MDRKDLKPYVEYDENQAMGFPPHYVYDAQDADAVLNAQESQIKDLKKEIRQIKIELLLEKAENAELHEDMLHKEHPEYLYLTDEEAEWSSKAQIYRNEANKLNEN